jgi:hypothetical protein
MPKVLIAGEKAFAVHSFTDDELNKIKITETRNDSVAKIGKVFDQPLTEELLNTVKASIMMFLKQSDSFKLKTEEEVELNGYVLAVFKGKTINGRKNYIASWLGKMPVEGVTQNPEALIQQLVKGFQKYLKISDYHKKSVIHGMLK